ncbi:MAG TPA: extensin family protein [Pseudolabrys sp.]|nr:extensin family protein [Pseudolabrys sp.]
MHTKSRFSRWLKAAAVLAVAECAGVAVVQAQSSGDFFRFDRSHVRYDKYRKNLFDPLGWERQRRKVHRRSDSLRSSPRVKAKSKPEQSEPATSKTPVGPANKTVEDVPLPRPRPPVWPEPRSFAEAAGPGFDSASVTGALSDCDQRLGEIAAIELLPRLIGPGECGGRDMIRLNAVLLPNRKRVEVRPTAVLRCAMAESFVAWVRDEASGHVAALGDELRTVDTLGSYDCRSRNSAADAKLSEHGKGNAVDVRALGLAGGRHIDLTDETVSKSVRDNLRDSACHRFTTVLGPGADSYHSNHIHLDILERHRGARICQWDVREPPPPPAKVARGRGRVRLAARSGPGRPDTQTVTAGPWAIVPTYKANKLQSCTMSRSDGDIGATFVRAQEGLSVTLESPKWKLQRGKTYPVRLAAGSRSVDARARAETKSVVIPLADSRLNSRLRSANNLQVHAEGATLRVPLDSSSAAFERLEECFNNGEAPKTNPLVKRNAPESNPFVTPRRKR